MRQMPLLALAVLAAACGVETPDDENLETDESAIQYCPDELCEPPEPDPATLKPDLAAGPPAPEPCNWVYTNIPTRGYRLSLRVYNNGKEHAAPTTARVRFHLWPNVVTAPIDVAILRTRNRLATLST